MKGFTNRTAKEPSEDSFVRGFGSGPQTGGKYKVGSACVHRCGGAEVYGGGGREADLSAGRLIIGVHRRGHLGSPAVRLERPWPQECEYSIFVVMSGQGPGLDTVESAL